MRAADKFSRLFNDEKNENRFASLPCRLCADLSNVDTIRRGAVESFLEVIDNQTLFIYFASNERVVATTEIPKQIRRKAVYFLKSKNIEKSIVKVEDLKNEVRSPLPLRATSARAWSLMAAARARASRAQVVCGEVSESSLASLSLLSHEVIYPLLSNPANRSGWSGPTSKEVMLKLSGFLASLHMTVGQSKVNGCAVCARPLNC